MERLRALWVRVVEATRRLVSPTERTAEMELFYKCTYCRCTFETQLEKCPECNIGRLAASGPGFESTPHSD